jgi:hypothetical protein
MDENVGMKHIILNIILLHTKKKQIKRNQTQITKDRLDHFDGIVVNPGSAKYHRESKNISYKVGEYVCNSHK